MESSPQVSSRRWQTLAALSALFIIFNVFLHFKEPIYDGDSFEYAGIARNILRGEGLREDLLRSYVIPDQPLPHPASQRANLYVYFVVPFYAVFGDSHWAFLAPSLIGLFLLPLVTYGVGRRLFGDDPAYFAALLILFMPSLLRLYYLMDPGLPEVWQMIFYLLFARFLYEERYAAAGLFMGLAYQFRQNSVILIPAVILWMALHRRKQLFGAGAFKLFAVAFLIVAPFLVRSWIVFGSPMHNEQIIGVSKVYDGTLREHFEEARMFGIVFNYEAYHGDGAPSGSPLSNFSSVLLANIKMAVFGKPSDMLYIPGMFQAAGLILLPFIALGVWAGRGSPTSSLLLTIIALQAAMHMLVIMYLDRYFLCVAPFAFMLCGAGISAFVRMFAKFPSLSFPRFAAGIIAFIILTESASFLIFGAARTAGHPQKNIYNELKTACAHIRENSEPGDVVMTYPFLSTHFLCDLPTVPLPYGQISSMAKVIEKYDVKHLVFASAWQGDLFPELPFTTLAARGMRLSLFEVSPSGASAYLEAPDSHYIESLNPVDHFLFGRFNAEFAPPLYKIASNIARGAPLGAIAYCAAFIFFMASFLGPKGFARSALLLLLSAAFVAAQVSYMSAAFSPLMAPPPPLSAVQASLAADTFPPEIQTLIVVESSDARARDIQSALSLRFPISSVVSSAPETIPDGAALFISIPLPESWLTDKAALAKNMKAQTERHTRARAEADARAANGEIVERVLGGIISR